MKKILALTLAVLTTSSVSNAWIVRGNGGNPGLATSRPLSVEECSDSLYVNLNVFSSLADRACSYGRTDAEFQRCVTSVTPSIGHQNVDVAGQACATTRNIDEANCALDLFFQGGQYVSNSAMASDGARLCAKTERSQLRSCIIDRYQNRRLSAADAAKVCLEQIDPVAKARREAELRRIAEVRANEQRRLADQRRLAERNRIQEQNRKLQEEQKKKEEARKRNEAVKQNPQAVVAPAPVDDGGGVIVDLPNFE